jgi:hypothetical protein
MALRAVLISGKWVDGPQARGYKVSVKQRFGPRPLRLGRLFGASPLYLVTFSAYHRKPWLANDEIQSAFVSFADRAKRILAFEKVPLLPLSETLPAKLAVFYPHPQDQLRRWNFPLRERSPTNSHRAP